jgi:hypothetical protein
MQQKDSGPICATVLAALPEWFGFPDSVAAYVEAAESNPTFVATVAGRDSGILTLRLHSPDAAESSSWASCPSSTGRESGRPCWKPPSWLSRREISYLQVKTLSSRHPDPAGYAATRAFSFSSGFRPLEEMPELWGSDQPAPDDQEYSPLTGRNSRRVLREVRARPPSGAMREPRQETVRAPCTRWRSAVPAR